MQSGDITSPVNNIAPVPPVSDSNKQKKSAGQVVREWLEVIIIALAISLPIRYFIAEPFVVEGASMDPTFTSGQFLIVDRLTYRFENPSRGDVIVFEYPNDPSTYFIKRIIGLPQEKISMEDGHVFVTGPGKNASTTEITEPYVTPLHSSHDTFNITLGPSEYFVMGDNRLQSSDSRVWGSLDKHFIVGRPIIRLFPLTAISILPGNYNESQSNNVSQ